MKRAIRRAHLRRMKAKAVRVFTVNRASYDNNEDPKRYEKWANHMKTCSCTMCGNPRKYYRGWHAKTIQEWKAFDAAKYED